MSPNKIDLFFIRRGSLSIKIGETIGEGRIVRRGSNVDSGSQENLVPR